MDRKIGVYGYENASEDGTTIVVVESDWHWSTCNICGGSLADGCFGATPYIKKHNMHLGSFYYCRKCCRDVHEAVRFAEASMVANELAGKKS